MTHALIAALRQWASANRFKTWGAALRWLRAHEIRQDRPVFASVDDVLRFAFSHETPTVKTSGAFAMAANSRDELFGSEDERERARAAPIRTRDPDLDRRPVGDDAVLQQAMVLGFVRRLPKHEHLWVCAKYAQGAERLAARRALRDALLPLLDSSVRPRYVVYELQARYFGKVVKLDDLAEKVVYMFHGQKRDKDALQAVRHLASQVESRLKDLAASAEEKCHDRFKTGGLIK